jgi:predicted GNAT family acetyltransferase
MAEPGPVINEIEDHRFILVREGLESELIYRRHRTQLILIHTEVPEQLRGKGVGALLVEAAVSWAERDGLVLVPWCPYARLWLRKHTAASSKVRIDWDIPRQSAPTDRVRSDVAEGTMPDLEREDM